MLDNHYSIHINKAINYILENITQAPNLEDVSRVSGFSKFHFHRLFKVYTGETLNQFIRRIRLEKAAFILLFDKDKTITDVALSCGFSNSQNFATAFKKHFSSTPKAYKENKACQGILLHDPDVIVKYDIRLMYLEALHSVYERFFGTYYDEDFYTQQENIVASHPKAQCITIFWDDPTITPKKYHRYDCGYILQTKSNHATKTLQTIDEDIYIILTLESDEKKEINRIEAWNYLYTNWLPRHGYAPSKLFCFEIIDSKGVKLHIPVKKI